MLEITTKSGLKVDNTNWTFDKEARIYIPTKQCVTEYSESRKLSRMTDAALKKYLKNRIEVLYGYIYDTIHPFTDRNIHEIALAYHEDYVRVLKKSILAFIHADIENAISTIGDGDMEISRFTEFAFETHKAIDIPATVKRQLHSADITFTGIIQYTMDATEYDGAWNNG